MTDNVKINRGLKGIYFERSGVSDIDGAKGELSYRGYSIHELAQSSSFEEVSYLLIYGELPTQAELRRFDERLRRERVLPESALEVIQACAAGHPMDVLRTTVSALAALDPRSKATDLEAFAGIGIRIMAQIPVIVAAHQAMRSGRALTPPDENLGHAANWLWMLNGEMPSAEATKLADVDLILHAEHGANASSFAARVAISTDTDLHGAIVAALATLAGPAHGGAAEDVMNMVHEIGKPENAAQYVTAKRAAREPVTGFGHRVYRAEDPRAKHMREGVRKLGQEKGQPEWFEILQAVVEAMKPYSRHGLNVNVDFYSGVMYQLHGIPMDLYVPIFAIGRMPGWIIQCIEQKQSNILIRPLTLYNGPAPRHYVPINER